MNPWEQPPPGAPGDRRVEIVRVPAGANWHAVATGNRVAALAVHHRDGRTVPCLLPWSGGCDACHKGLGWRREGYLSAFVVSRRQSVVLALPDKALEQLERLAADRLRQAKLRGYGFSLVRAGDSRRAPLKIEPAADWVGALEPGVDVPLILCRAWGMPALFEDWKRRLRGDAAAG